MTEEDNTEKPGETPTEDKPQERKPDEIVKTAIEENGSEEAAMGEEEFGEASEGEEIQKTFHPLNQVNNSELVRLVTNLELETKRLELESKIFDNFLHKHDPAALEGMADVLKMAAQLQEKSPGVVLRSVIGSQASRSMSAVKLASRASLISTTDKGPRINMSQKTDMAMSEIEETQENLEKFYRKSHHSKCNLKAEIEELNLRTAETEEATNIFEKSIVRDAVDELTQRIPAEKFVRYMEEWLKSAQSIIDKVRLRSSTLKTQYRKLIHQLRQKELMGEHLHRVDFDQLQIQNKHLREEIEQKTSALLKLKEITGIANLTLSTQKKWLLAQMEEMKELKDEIALCDKKIEQLDDINSVATKELDEAKTKFDLIKNLIDKYEVPDVMKYVVKKSEMRILKKNIKVFSRRKYMKDMALLSCVREMKYLTGEKNADPAWFICEGDKSESSGNKSKIESKLTLMSQFSNTNKSM